MVHYSASVSLVSMNTISKRKTSSKVHQAVEVEADIAKKEHEIEMQKEIYKQILGLKSEYKMEKQEMDGSVGEDQGNNDVVKDLSEQSEKMEVCQKLSGKEVSEHSKNTEHSQEQVEGRTFGSEKEYLNLTKCLDGSCSYLARNAKTNPIPEAQHNIIGNELIEMSEVEYNTMRDTLLEEDTTSEDEFCDVDLSEFGIELSISESDVSFSSHQFLVMNESAASSHTSSQISTTNDQDQISAQRNWKRTVLLMWKEIAGHRFASLFLNPVSEERVPGYHSWVHRPMDLSNIKRNIRKGLIRTTVEFQRDIMLMFQNAVMYNSSDHDVYHKTVEMQRDVLEQIQDILEVVELGDYNRRFSGKSLHLMDK